MGKILQFILSRHMSRHFKMGLILVAGYAVFVMTAAIRNYSHHALPFEILMEPLLICMIGSFYVTNFTGYRDRSDHGCA